LIVLDKEALGFDYSGETSLLSWKKIISSYFPVKIWAMWKF